MDIINQAKVVDNTNGFYIFEIILASGALCKQSFSCIFFNFFYILFLCIYLMYNTVDSISSQLAILHMPGVIFIPSRNGPERIYLGFFTARLLT